MKKVIKNITLSAVALMTVGAMSANAMPHKMVDLKVQNIFLTPDCKVAVKIENVGNRRIPMFFWRRNVLRVTPKVMIKKNNHVVKYINLVDIPNSEVLSFPGGSVVYKTNIKVNHGATIKAIVDSTNILLERNEANNRLQRTLSCNVCNINRKPDLVIKSFGLERWGECEPNRAVMYFRVKIKNIGNAPTPNITTKALVQVMDQDGSHWGNGAIVPKIYPGQTRSVTIPVYYLKANPAHMQANIIHKFRAIADPLHLVDEKNEANNKSSILRVRTSHFCQ